MKAFIIDDDHLSTFLTQSMLELEGVAQEVYAYHSAVEALEALRVAAVEQLPSVILLDLNMPIMDGWELLAALVPLEQKLSGKCRIYILTSSLDSSDMSRMQAFPIVSGFIQKPISSEDIELIFQHNRS
jgi:CheY-like chemotaxis protein